METSNAIRILSAMAQDSRLAVFRLLVRQGTSGMAAGDIARRLDIPHNTMSSHLGILAAAGLVSSCRQGRSIIYVAELAALRRLLSFLVEDCCQGRPEFCEPLLDQVLPGCLGDLPAHV